ncbi:MAG: carboxypeptidase regulatory-like domain-containing protein [Acidobacteria bacterium]|nr:carboxypeptidase regulatory-like domain-containing protein [Acidobacteriota bacterium]
MNKQRLIGLCIAAMFVTGARGFAAGATITGKIALTGEAPAPKKIAVTQDTSVCGAEKLLQEIQVSPDKGVRYAVVRLIGAKGAAPAPAGNVVIDQKGCMFAPPVVVVPKGGSLDIANDDGILHNVHSHSTANSAFNRSQPGFLKKITQKFDRVETVRLNCDIHGWMTGWVVVAEDSFVAVTDGSGGFKLSGVPAGTYKLEVWHPVLGAQTKDVTVADGGEAKVNFELAVK